MTNEEQRLVAVLVNIVNALAMVAPIDDDKAGRQLYAAWIDAGFDENALREALDARLYDER